jgi:HEPN domain-containing protein
MRLPEQAKRKVVADWLLKAQNDFGLVEFLVDQGGVFPSQIAFHCQQAAEKYLKAFLTWFEVIFPKTHDLEVLLNLVAGVNAGMAKELWHVIVLTPYGVEMRYPGDRPEVTVEEAREAVELARLVRERVMGVLPGGEKGT